MTIKELSQVFQLRQEIQEDAERINALEAVLMPHAHKISGLPHGDATHDLIGETVPIIVDLQRELEQHQANCVKEASRLMEYIDGIDDAFLRRIYKLRYYDCLTWDAVAMAMGGRNTPDSVKKACYRHMKHCSQ